MLLALADAFLEGGLSVFGGCYERVISVATEQEEPNATNKAAGNEVSVTIGDSSASISVRNVQTRCGYTIHVIDQVLLPCNITRQLEDIGLQE